MKVKVGNVVYDGLNEPVMVILNDRDKTAILDLDIEDEKYCHYPAGMNAVRINEWMNQDKPLPENPKVKQLEATNEVLVATIARLQPALLDQYVTALLAGEYMNNIGLKEQSLSRAVFDLAKHLIDERNKLLTEIENPVDVVNELQRKKKRKKKKPYTSGPK